MLHAIWIIIHPKPLLAATELQWESKLSLSIGIYNYGRHMLLILITMETHGSFSQNPLNFSIFSGSFNERQHHSILIGFYFWLVHSPRTVANHNRQHGENCLKPRKETVNGLPHI